MNKYLLTGLLALAPLSLGTSLAASIDLRLLESTDLHTNALGYDYYQDKPTGEYGFEYTAGAIAIARGEVKNSLTFDNGDLIQGNPLGDYVAKIKPLKAGEMHPMHKAMAVVGYDAANIGNHEFNYGLPFLEQVLSAAPMPYVNANVYSANGRKNEFTPYIILNKKVVDSEGNEQTVKVGVIGFVPPQIMQWDKSNLEGKVTAKDIIATANKFVPKMRLEADIIVAIAHSGLGSNDADFQVGAENATSALTKVPGVDVVLFGHSHAEFPGTAFKDYPGANIAKGQVNGKAAVMPGFWGNNLGVVDLKLEKVGSRWKVVDSKSSLRPIWDKVAKKNLVAADPRVALAVAEAHKGTLEYVRGKVSELVAPINSYFALVQDDPSVQLVSNAQIAYVKNALQGTPNGNLPILSAAAPFKAGGRAGPSNYTDIPAGTLAIKNVADLYVFPNTVKAVVISGAGVKEWLERSAGQFRRIDPKGAKDQVLVDDSFPTYNFDVIDGVTYEIDVTQPSKYDGTGKVVNAGAERIKNLKFNGAPIDPAAKFVVATNNYRASGGGNFPGLDGKNIVLDAPDENRQALIQYFNAQGKVNPSADGNWKLTPIPGQSVIFVSSPNAEKYLPAGVVKVKVRDDGFAEYRISW